MFRIGIIIGICFLSVSFLLKEEGPDNSEQVSSLVQKELEKKLSKYKKNKRDACLKKVLRDAEIHVDSIIIKEINIRVVDTLVFPEKPVRPNYPKEIVLNDSVKIEPLDTLR